jgi:hypothetical protein
MGCVNSVEDKHAAGTRLSGERERQSNFQADAAAAVAEMLGGAGTSSQVEISLKCRGLPDKDTFSKSDPMAVLYMRDGRSSWSEADRSDTVANSLGTPRPSSYACRLRLRSACLPRPSTPADTPLRRSLPWCRPRVPLSAALHIHLREAAVLPHCVV